MLFRSLASLTVGILALHEAAHLSGSRSLIAGFCLIAAIIALVILARAAAGKPSAPRNSPLDTSQLTEYRCTVFLAGRKPGFDHTQALR